MDEVKKEKKTERYLVPQAARDRVEELRQSGHLSAACYKGHRHYVVQYWVDATD